MRKLIFAAALALPLVTSIRADDLSKQVVRVSETKTLDAAVSGTLHFENSRGEVNIEGWDQPKVEITVVRSTEGLYRVSDPAQRDAAKQLLDRIQIQSERRGDETAISTQVSPRDRRKASREVIVEYDIKAPRDSKVVIDAGNGGVYVTGITGDMNATMKQGQLTLALPENAEYSIDARAKIGNVYWEGDGQEQRHHLFGHSFASGHSSSSGHSSLSGHTVSGGPSAAGQTVPINVTSSVNGVEVSRRIDAPLVPDPTKPQHKLNLNVGYGDIVIMKSYGEPEIAK